MDRLEEFTTDAIHITLSTRDVITHAFSQNPLLNSDIKDNNHADLVTKTDRFVEQVIILEKLASGRAKRVDLV